MGNDMKITGMNNLFVIEDGTTTAAHLSKYLSALENDGFDLGSIMFKPVGNSKDDALIFHLCWETLSDSSTVWNLECESVFQSIHDDYPNLGEAELTEAEKDTFYKNTLGTYY